MSPFGRKQGLPKKLLSINCVFTLHALAPVFLTLEQYNFSKHVFFQHVNSIVLLFKTWMDKVGAGSSF